MQQQFLLRICNSKTHKHGSESINELMHGYGLNNVKEYVEKNHGILTIKDTDYEYEVVVLLPIALPPPYEKITKKQIIC